ncbi:trypsin-like peptidase domain-containing protein [Chromohalobacter israelensis]|uniref:trypsin-like peptidase domain-containing protein n=1 Tax=Chromohalobacter israelensis TaxID=141390 RepID=UPI000FFEF503|nr:trypsin-like peptidase domain-containing protein [Chromohalobacter salexigens]RXE48807.1 hypothetical protein B4O83_12855 [Chromohalobacter salexigens]
MIEEVCRPVLFEQEDSEYPYWGKGSSVLVANSSYYYWVTAAHVIDKMGGSADSLRIFSSESSRVSLPYNQQYRIEDDGGQPEDYRDLFVLRVDLEEFASTGDAPLTAQDVEQGAMPAEELSEGTRLLVVGYPSESRAVDYEQFKIEYKRQWIPAEYAGPGADNHCHKMILSESAGLNDYDGLSGSPVLYEKSYISKKLAIVPILVGLLLRGGAQSRHAHFVSANVLVNLIQKAEDRNA